VPVEKISFAWPADVIATRPLSRGKRRAGRPFHKEARASPTRATQEEGALADSESAMPRLFRTPRARGPHSL
jgi:hypothetical protein